MTEYITITPTARLRIEIESGPECPRDGWHMLTGFVKIPGDGDSRIMDVPAVHDDPTGNIAYAHDHFEYQSGIRTPNTEEIVARWARVFHGLHIEYDAEHGGYWFVAGADAATAATEVDGYSRALFYDNWPDLAVGTAEHLAKQAEVIAGEQETYRQWAEGEVYGVILERAETCGRVEYNAAEDVWDLVNPLTEDDLTTEWEEEDSIWGNYLSDTYTAQMVAIEHFTLSVTEAEALAR